MKLLLEVKESKAAFLLDLLENFSFVKTKRLLSEDEADIKAFDKAIKKVTDGKAQFISLAEVMENMPKD